MEVCGEHVLDDIVKKYSAFVKKPENYLKVQNNIVDDVKKLIKSLYDYIKLSEVNPVADALPELIIEDFDEEQIWQQIELQNEGVLDKFINDISNLAARKQRIKFPIQKEAAEIVDHDAEEKSLSENEQVVAEDQETDSEHVSLDGGSDGLSEENTPTENEKQKSSVVDDQFFKLQEMQKFLDREDRKELSHNHSFHKKGKDSDDETDDESIDYFEDLPSDDDSEKESGSKAKYSDFFDAPNRSAKKMNVFDDSGGDTEHRKTVRFDLPDDKEEGEEDEEEEDDDQKEGLPDREKAQVEESLTSSLERRMARLQQKVDELEQQALSADKPWQIRGEVEATARPHNSLLEEAVEFDSVTRPAPVRTEKTTLKLEDIIRQRIKDRAWDDVERKQRPVESPHEYRKRLVLDQEKSKLSLAQIYEEEYLKRKESVSADNATGNQDKPEEEPAEHREIRMLMSKLFNKLDALSNFHYTPKLAAPEVKVVTNMPAVTLEEVTPAATSDATLLAPEEIRPKPKGGGVVPAGAEKTATDRKRERRHKKALQKKRAQRRTEKQRSAGTLVRGSNITQAKQSGADRDVKSSSAFFSRLQDEVRAAVHGHEHSKRKVRSNNDHIAAKKLKL